MLLVTTFLSAQSYREVTIGNKTWMAENLNVVKFRNGDTIPNAKSMAEWIKAGKNGQPAWCYFNNETLNGTKYGKLYNFFAVADPRGLAPDGWHVASDEEWTSLIAHLGGEDVAGNKMKTPSLWKNAGNIVGPYMEAGSSNGNNSSGFSGLPGGYRNYTGNFESLSQNGYWWSSTEYSTTSAWAFYLSYYNGKAIRMTIQNSRGYSVRCVKD